VLLFSPTTTQTTKLVLRVVDDDDDVDDNGLVSANFPFSYFSSSSRCYDAERAVSALVTTSAELTLSKTL
jgi:hypothetical protein